LAIIIDAQVSGSVFSPGPPQPLLHCLQTSSMAKERARIADLIASACPYIVKGVDIPSRTKMLRAFPAWFGDLTNNSSKFAFPVSGSRKAVSNFVAISLRRKIDAATNWRIA